MNQFLEGLKSELSQQHLTQKELSEMTGISINTIRGWFSKDLIPDTLIAVKVAKALNTSVEYLITGQVDSSAEKELKELKQTIKLFADKL